MVLKNPHPMDFVFVLPESECPKECMKPKGESNPLEEGGFWNEFDYSTICEHLRCFVGNDGENVKECDKIKGAYDQYYLSKFPIFPSSSDDVRLIVVGKQNSPEKPCRFCGSITGCDCPLEIVEHVMNEDELSRKLWSGICLWFPPFSPDGKPYRTKFKSKKYDPKTRTMTVEMELIPEEEGKEGWGFPPRGSNKAHYFLENGMSLCGKYGFYRGPREQDLDDSPDNCTACKKALKRLRERRQADQRLNELEEKGKIKL